MAKQKFTLDTTNLLGDLTTETTKMIDPTLQSFLVEGYHPILVELEALYKENPKLNQDDDRLKKLSATIELSLESDPLLMNKTSIDHELGDHTKATPTHLAFVLQGLKNGKNLQEVMEGYEYQGNTRIGLADRFERQFNADFRRIPPKVIDQKGVVLDENIFGSITKYVSLKSILSELKELNKKEPKLNKNDKRLQDIYKKVAELSESLNDAPTLIPKISKKALSEHLDFILSSIDSGKSLKYIMKGSAQKSGLQARFDKWDGWFAKPTKTTARETLKLSLNLSDEQLKFIISRFNQRSITGADNALGRTADGERKEIFYVHNEQGKLALKAVQHECSARNLLMDKDGFIVLDKDDQPTITPWRKTSYLANVSGLKKNDQPGEKFIALPTQKAEEHMTCEALCPEANYQLPEVIKHRTRNNQLLAKEAELLRDQLKEIASTPGIETELLSDNLKKLTKAASKAKLPLTTSMIENVIKNEIAQVKKDNPKLSNGVFSNALTQKIQANLADTFNNENIKSDKGLSANLDQYIEHKEPSILTRISQYIHAKFIHQTDIDKYKDIKSARKLSAITSSLSGSSPPDATPKVRSMSLDSGMSFAKRVIGLGSNKPRSNSR